MCVTPRGVEPFPGRPALGLPGGVRAAGRRSPVSAAGRALRRSPRRAKAPRTGTASATTIQPAPRASSRPDSAPCTAVAVPTTGSPAVPPAGKRSSYQPFPDVAVQIVGSERAGGLLGGTVRFHEHERRLPADAWSGPHRAFGVRELHDGAGTGALDGLLHRRLGVQARHPDGRDIAEPLRGGPDGSGASRRTGAIASSHSVPPACGGRQSRRHGVGRRSTCNHVINLGAGSPASPYEAVTSVPVGDHRWTAEAG